MPSISYIICIVQDVCDDVEGAMQLGIFGILVKTGKYRENDEQSISPPPHLVCNNFSSAVETILGSNVQK